VRLTLINDVISAQQQPFQYLKILKVVRNVLKIQNV